MAAAEEQRMARLAQRGMARLAKEAEAKGNRPDKPVPKTPKEPETEDEEEPLVSKEDPRKKDPFRLSDEEMDVSTDTEAGTPKRPRTKPKKAPRVPF